MDSIERIVFDAANSMEAAFQCGPRDVQRFAVIIREAINAAIAETHKENAHKKPEAAP